MKIYSIAVVGPGLIGREHISLIEKNPRCRLHSIVAPEDVYSVNDTLVFKSLQDCFTHSTPDGVIVSSPTQYHYEHSSYCLERGVKCLVEKPICGSVEEARRLLNFPNCEINLLVGHHRHYSSVIDDAKTNLTQGILGDLRTVMASAQYYKPDDYFLEKKWRLQAGIGGVLLINAIHDIGLLRHLIGEIAHVQAFGRKSRMSSIIHGTVSINLSFVNGVIGSLVVSDEVSSAFSWEVTSGENPSFPTYSDGFAYILGGTRGSMSLPTGSIYHDPHTNGWKEEMIKTSVGHKIKNPLEIQLNHFLDMIQSNASPKICITDGINNLSVIEAIIDSLSKSGSLTPVYNQSVR